MDCAKIPLRDRTSQNMIGSMELASGSKLGPYEIKEKLGAGGMGEVYRARDVKLRRDVALKVLPQAFAIDADRMTRFQREAQVLASLNHPNIAAIYGLEESGGVRALVMELVEGPTLADRLKSGAMPLEEALPIARQIVEALEAAHEKGITHRDLKPANVKVTPEGAVKVLDFGLAKAGEGAAAPSDPSNSPTLTAAATQAGMVMGTAAYMAPEQARGHAVDKRADIWSFGAVLFEMLTGRQAFQGETTTDILASLLKVDPDWDGLPASTPPSIVRLLHRCLTKDRKQRLQAIGEARIVIDQAISGPAEPEEARSQSVARRSRREAMTWVLVGILALVAAGVGLWAWFAPRIASAPPVLAYIPPPPGTSFRFFGFSAGPVVVSPDGKNLAFSATDQKGVTRIWVRPLASGEAKPLAGTEDGAQPFWSPDSQALGFFADEKLKTITLDGGTVKVLGDALCGDGAWSSEGSILFVPECGGPIAAIPAAGGTARPVVQPGSGASEVGSPSPLPGGDEFLYVSYQLREPSPAERERLPSIRMASLSTGKSEAVLSDARSPQFASGHLLFLRGGRVYAQRFDPGNGKLKGEAMPLAEARTFSVSANGTLAFQGGKTDARLEWFDRSGNSLGTLGGVELWLAPRISPDGKRVLAFAQDSQNRSADLWSYPAKGGVGTRLTFGPDSKGFPCGHLTASTSLIPAFRTTICLYVANRPMAPAPGKLC